MRQLILQRLEVIKKLENGFSRPSRWNGWFIDPSSWERSEDKKNKQNIHLSKIDFSKLPDDRLLVVYESIIRQSNKQIG